MGIGEQNRKICLIFKKTLITVSLFFLEKNYRRRETPLFCHQKIRKKNRVLPSAKVADLSSSAGHLIESKSSSTLCGGAPIKFMDGAVSPAALDQSPTSPSLCEGQLLNIPESGEEDNCPSCVCVTCALRQLPRVAIPLFFLLLC